VLDSSEAIVVAVEENMGVAFVPTVTAERCMTWGRIRTVPVDGLAITRWLYLVDNTNRLRTPPANAFWSYVEELQRLALTDRHTVQTTTAERERDALGIALQSLPERPQPSLN